MWKEWDDFEKELEERTKLLKEKEEKKMRDFKAKKKPKPKPPVRY